MSANFAFYVHHHGSGHVMRAIAIASRLKDSTIYFMGSDLARYQHLIPAHIQCYHLPGDVAQGDDHFARSAELDFLHYAPLNVPNALKRTAMISGILSELFPVLLVVDVSVEVTMLAALCGVPTVVIRQNGNRNDLPHLNAYQSAQKLIAPSPMTLMNRSDYHWVEEKTFFSGGFSRYNGAREVALQMVADAVGVLTGSGGTSINALFINLLSAQCPDKTFHILGKIEDTAQLSNPNLIVHGMVANPAEILSACEVVIGNAGHNTVMEMAELDKRFICVYEDRPFEEQQLKAQLLAKHQMAIVINGNEILQANWNTLFNQAKNLRTSRWNGVIDPDAIEKISEELHHQWQKQFSAL